MSRENSHVAAIAVIAIAGLFVLLLLGGAAFLVFGLFAVRSAGPPPAASVSPPPTTTVAPAKPVVDSLLAAVGDIPLTIDYEGIITADGQVQSEEQLREYFASYKAAEKVPDIFVHENAPPERLEHLQQLCIEIIGASPEVKVITAIGGIRAPVVPPAELPAESPSP
jgi:hypothetical protein